MIRINTKLLDLYEIYTNLSYYTTLDMVGNLTLIETELEDVKQYLMEKDFGHHLAQIITIDKQLIFVKKNLKTLNDALLLHESKAYEKRPSLKDLQIFYLN